ncbi:MAG: hypothetical protein M5U19_02570 [Microthrixaceae bacterium]|nr:hypothetical protein [Microthrixaceae bacterium]
MGRRSTDVLDRSLREQAVAALIEAVGGVQPAGNSTEDLEIELDGHWASIEVKTMAYATVDRVEALKRKVLPSGDRSVLVVADRINQPAQVALREAGWGYLDLATGRLFLRAPGIRIDTTVDVVEPGERPKPVGVVGRAGRVVAYELLRRRYDRDPRPVLTTTSFDQFDLARSSTSDARRALIGAGLLTEDGEPVLPELFWALAREWAPTDRRWLASVPDPKDWDRAHDPTEPTWRLGGTQAAIALGAPIVSGGETPAEFYVPGHVLLSIAARRYGSSDPLAAAASVAVPVVHQVTAPPIRHRVNVATAAGSWSTRLPPPSTWRRRATRGRSRCSPNGNPMARPCGMSTDVPTVVLTGSAMVPLVRAAAALEAENIPPFAVIGGVAVTVRLGRTLRATADLDAVTDQRYTPTALEVLRARDDATYDAADPHTITISGAEVQFQDVEPVDDADVSHLDDKDLLYVAAHAHALAAATPVRLLAAETRTEATVPVATTGASSPPSSTPTWTGVASPAPTSDPATSGTSTTCSSTSAATLPPTSQPRTRGSPAWWRRPSATSSSPARPGPGRAAHLERRALPGHHRRGDQLRRRSVPRLARRAMIAPSPTKTPRRRSAGPPSTR